MLPCEKRQKIVKSDGEVKHRCINRECDAYRHYVDEEACSVCPVRVTLHEPSSCRDIGKPVQIQEPEPCEGCNESADRLEKALSKELKLDEIEIRPEDTPTGEVPDYPPMSLQLWLYKEALLRWHRAGRPVRSDEEVKDILKICQGCDWYDPEAKRCKGCGCHISDGGIPVTNKLKMATESCPHPEKKW